MRESYHDELNATSGRILTMAELVRVAVKDATAALIGADLTTAERVISDDSKVCLLYTSPSPRDRQKSRMPSSA